MHKGGQINNAIDHWGEDCRDVTTKLQCRVQIMEVIVKMIKSGGLGVRGMCTKNGSYCEKGEKIRKQNVTDTRVGLGVGFVKLL